MDVSYIAAAPALARLHQEHHHRPDPTTRHQLDAARLRRERSYVRRLLRRVGTRRGFDDQAPLVPATLATPTTTPRITVG